MSYKCLKCAERGITKIYRSKMAMYNHLQNNHKISVTVSKLIKNKYIEKIEDVEVKESWNDADDNRSSRIITAKDINMEKEVLIDKDVKVKNEENSITMGVVEKTVTQTIDEKAETKEEYGFIDTSDEKPIPVNVKDWEKDSNLLEEESIVEKVNKKDKPEEKKND